MSYLQVFTMNRAIKYRIYPTASQSYFFAKTFGCCRKVWNLMLADAINNYKEAKTFNHPTPAYYKKEYEYLKDVDSLALANVQLNLNSAFKNCFSKSRKKRNDFPRFKSKKTARKSYTTNNQKGTVAVCDGYIRLPKIGNVKAVIHRKPNDSWKVKSATVSQSSDNKFYVSVLYEFDVPVCNSLIDVHNSLGLDYSSSHLYVDNNGDIGTNHKFFKESQKKLAKEQRRLSRKIGFKKSEVKSNNFYKQLAKVNKIHRHIANQRLDNLHKKSTEISNQYDIVCVEDLNMKAMSNKGFGNGKATLDNGYGMFLSMLEYKLSDRGKLFIKADKFYPSSQLCHCCNYKNPLVKDLSIRKWVCPSCGSYHDRDVNAAINILQYGLNLYETRLNVT